MVLNLQFKESTWPLSALLYHTTLSFHRGAPLFSLILFTSQMEGFISVPLLKASSDFFIAQEFYILAALL